MRISTKWTGGQLGPDETGEIFIEKIEEDGRKSVQPQVGCRSWREECACQTEEWWLQIESQE